MGDLSSCNILCDHTEQASASVPERSAPVPSRLLKRVNVRGRSVLRSLMRAGPPEECVDGDDNGYAHPKKRWQQPGNPGIAHRRKQHKREAQEEPSQQQQHHGTHGDEAEPAGKTKPSVSDRCLANSLQEQSGADERSQEEREIQEEKNRKRKTYVQSTISVKQNPTQNDKLWY